MPELPEVEVVRGGVAEYVAGRRLAGVEVLHPRAVRGHPPGPEDFASVLAGRVVEDVSRRGKYLWLSLGDVGGGEEVSGAGQAVLAHLGMSGQLLVQPSGAVDEKHLRVRFRFADDGPELRFVDQRTFGGLSLAELVPSTGLAVPDSIGHIAADPLEPSFDREAVVRLVRSRRTGIKRALLDQNLISGIGNIYADEALWRARLHWAHPTAELDEGRAHALLDSVVEVLGEALVAGGTSFDSLYVNVNGRSGYFSRSLSVYGRAGSPCPRCGTAIRRDAFTNRSSYSCPSCQPVPPEPHW
ncbi:bifunctional DNA-formamidopyrimidine glycosylase/DNA-(apurinic or apyrimidinic site) lyase [Actinopolyspora xinjiangensis]|uniref:bifunctional DNA-formamidopyrimidine glycosylase/DNA-(apurinic or apyrimidinic site) lyase n=1 Tax=Actinopolyspora xinjiangensis TaxID=405564 RepID=UPI000B80B082|nr:bifunctional DNA-formamidopyrimidine glycosylase/DNA-(apurinic or apyrimidinic site) lyase [Actinopolyspora xinjiangensis]